MLKKFSYLDLCKLVYSVSANSNGLAKSVPLHGNISEAAHLGYFESLYDLADYVLILTSKLFSRSLSPYAIHDYCILLCLLRYCA